MKVKRLLGEFARIICQNKDHVGRAIYFLGWALIDPPIHYLTCVIAPWSPVWKNQSEIRWKTHIPNLVHSGMLLKHSKKTQIFKFKFKFKISKFGGREEYIIS